MTSRANGAAIQVDRLSKRVGNRLVLDAVTLVVRAGAACGIAAPNGAGKSLLLDILAGYAAPTSGRVRLLGHDPRAAALRGQVAALAQRPMLDAADSVAGLLGYLADLAGVARATAVPPVLERLALTELAAERVGELSEGVRRRVALAAVLIGRPRIVLLDEPGAGLDPVARRSVDAAVRELKRSATVVVASSDPAYVESMCDEVFNLGVANKAAHDAIGDVAERTRLTTPQQGAWS